MTTIPLTAVAERPKRNNESFVDSLWAKIKQRKYIILAALGIAAGGYLVNKSDPTFFPRLIDDFKQKARRLTSDVERKLDDALEQHLGQPNEFEALFINKLKSDQPLTPDQFRDRVRMMLSSGNLSDKERGALEQLLRNPNLNDSEISDWINAQVKAGNIRPEIVGTIRLANFNIIPAGIDRGLYTKLNDFLGGAGFTRGKDGAWVFNLNPSENNVNPISRFNDAVKGMSPEQMSALGLSKGMTAQEIADWVSSKQSWLQNMETQANPVTIATGNPLDIILNPQISLERRREIIAQFTPPGNQQRLLQELAAVPIGSGMSADTIGGYINQLRGSGIDAAGLAENMTAEDFNNWVNSIWDWNYTL